MSVPESKIKPATPANLKLAGKQLREGGLVAFPTETVYGLGGDATNDQRRPSGMLYLMAVDTAAVHPVSRQWKDY